MFNDDGISSMVMSERFHAAAWLIVDGGSTLDPNDVNEKITDLVLTAMRKAKKHELRKILFDGQLVTHIAPEALNAARSFLSENDATVIDLHPDTRVHL